MKNKIALLSLVFVLTACSKNIDLTKNAPDYSSFIDEFVTFAYASPTDGRYTEDGTTYYTGQDYRTKERYEEYKNAGLNTMMIQRVDPYNGEEWSTSQLKKNMDNTLAAGLKRCIVFDERLYALSENTKAKLIPDLYPTMDDLVNYVMGCMVNYISHEAYYGLMLMDEPSYTNFENYGLIYQAIEKASSTLGKVSYIESNLLPYSTNSKTKARYVANPNDYTDEAAYEKYVNDFVDATKCNKILMDSYPILYDGASYSLSSTHLRGCQLLANIAKTRGLEFNAVAQTCSYTSGGNISHGSLNAATMNWQMNAYMGFGVKKFGYFTYWRKKENTSTNEWFYDGSSFISQYGEKTDLYYAMQNIHKEMQAFAPTLSQFEYLGAQKFVTDPSYSTDFIDAISNDNFTALTNVNINSARSVLVTELKDNAKNNYMYMVMNACDPDISKDRDLNAEVKLNFNGFNAVSVYYKGNRTNIALNNGEIKLDNIAPGYAYYLIPYNA